MRQNHGLEGAVTSTRADSLPPFAVDSLKICCSGPAERRNVLDGKCCPLECLVTRSQIRHLNCYAGFLHSLRCARNSSVSSI
jgi:hypothetical protein